MKIIKRVLLGLVLCLIAALILFPLRFRSNGNHLRATVVIDKPPFQCRSTLPRRKARRVGSVWLVNVDQKDSGTFIGR